MAGSPLQGQRLILTVSALTSLGFMLIGYDNGLMGGLGTSRPPPSLTADCLPCLLVNTPAFNTTFGSPDTAMIGLIVAIFEGT